MTTIHMDETTEAGQRILSEPAANPETGKIREYEIPCDENGDPVGTPWEDVLEDMYSDLSEHYGVDLRTL
ncbi:MAG: hypothetical protein LBP50_05645 [Tannerella sp.]|jgi:hypothetical protein|nr:hypothetical protein [Tannerella sp.]